MIKSSLARWDALKARPSAAKAACVAGSNGMAEAMPFPKPARPEFFGGLRRSKAPSLHGFFRRL